jgi:hypothetical protein
MERGDRSQKKFNKKLLRTRTLFTTSTIYRTLCAMLFALCEVLLTTGYWLLFLVAGAQMTLRTVIFSLIPNKNSNHEM